MGKCCKDMTSRLKKAQHETAELIEKTSNLQQDKDKLRIRREILKAFLQRYQLQPEEQAALSGDQPLDDSFFTAFERVKVIHSECTRLLRTNQQQAGLDIMDEMTTLQERAYERLYAWTRGSLAHIVFELLFCLTQILLFHGVRCMPWSYYTGSGSDTITSPSIPSVTAPTSPVQVSVVQRLLTNVQAIFLYRCGGGRFELSQFFFLSMSPKQFYIPLW